LVACKQCGLTPRSRRGPTAKRQARLQVRFIILPPGLARCRRSRLNSNVRPHKRRRCVPPRQLPSSDSALPYLSPESRCLFGLGARAT
jgi:hypothetical protein